MSDIVSDRVRYPGREYERPASTKASGSRETTKGGLVESLHEKMTVQKLVFHRVQYMLKYIFLSTANLILRKSPEVMEENAVLRTESCGVHKSQRSHGVRRNEMSDDRCTCGPLVK